MDATEKRQALLEKQRAQMQADFQNLKDKIIKDNIVNVSSDISHKFASQYQDLEAELKKDTVGLVTFEDFQKRRELLEQKRILLEQQQKRDQQKVSTKASLLKAKRPKLSFHSDGEDAISEEEEEETEDGNKKESQHQQQHANPKEEGITYPQPAMNDITTRKIPKKNPSVDTSFLPDRDRDAQERQVREQLRAEWQAEQEALKREPMEVTFSYFDGSGHRRSVECVKGNTIAQFIDKAKAHFKDIKHVSVDQLMFIKEDVILPQHLTFYDLIVTQARGKHGVPLFHFDVHDDIRLMNDARAERNEAHAGKLVERRWFEKNKHIFPASRWQVFDPDKNVKPEAR